MPRDPRLFQIAALSSLALYGTFGLAFDLDPLIVVTLLATCQCTQWLCTRLAGLPRFDPRSALISSLSLCLLLRTGSVGLAATVATIAIASKFVLRWRGRHLFNPTALALLIGLRLLDGVWVSAGQWGATALFGLALFGVGSLVVFRAERSDVTYAFIITYAALLFGRATWLGDPWSIPIHQLSSGSLLLFAFFMISDPKTTPRSRRGRIAYAALVASGAFLIQFALFRPNGLLWSLVVLAPCVPLIDRLFSRNDVARPSMATRNQRRFLMPATVRILIALLLCAGFAMPPAEAFCGFYVAKADTKLFNEASRVALVRNGDRTVLTMANDFRGDPQEFAIVIPVPTFLTEEQIHVTDNALLDHLDAYTSPRLVEYFDGDPCHMRREMRAPGAMKSAGMSEDLVQEAKRLGVTIEATYSIGEYDILILNAEQSNGLERWLRDNGYRIPQGASQVLGSYLKQGMRFFVAKVNLEQQSQLGFTYLRPLQIAFESPKFMLPIRLGTLNAKGEQELFVFALTRNGRVETTNYRTVKLASDVEIPTYVKGEFADFYRDMFRGQVRKENGRAVFLEYAWNMGWCDPCAADPLSTDQLRELGVFWIEDGNRGNAAQEVYVTRLHVRYDADHFPEDLVFQETADTSNFQGRYIVRHEFKGPSSCPDEMEVYRRTLRERWEREATTLASLTGWGIDEIRARMNRDGQQPAGSSDPWWRKIWR